MITIDNGHGPHPPATVGPGGLGPGRSPQRDRGYPRSRAIGVTAAVHLRRRRGRPASRRFPRHAAGEVARPDTGGSAAEEYVITTFASSKAPPRGAGRARTATTGRSPARRRRVFPEVFLAGARLGARRCCEPDRHRHCGHRDRGERPGPEQTRHGRRRRSSAGRHRLRAGRLTGASLGGGRWPAGVTVSSTDVHAARRGTTRATARGDVAGAPATAFNRSSERGASCSNWRGPGSRRRVPAGTAAADDARPTCSERRAAAARPFDLVTGAQAAGRARTGRGPGGHQVGVVGAGLMARTGDAGRSQLKVTRATDIDRPSRKGVAYVHATGQAGPARATGPDKLTRSRAWSAARCRRKSSPTPTRHRAVSRRVGQAQVSRRWAIVSHGASATKPRRCGDRDASNAAPERVAPVRLNPVAVRPVLEVVRAERPKTHRCPRVAVGKR